MGTSTIGLNGVSVTSHAAEGYAGEIERVMVRSMAVPTVMVRGTKARLVTITTAQLMVSSTIGQTGALAVSRAEVVINYVSAPALVHSSAVKIALVHVKTQRHATNITALLMACGNRGSHGAHAQRAVAEAGRKGKGNAKVRFTPDKRVKESRLSHGTVTITRVRWTGYGRSGQSGARVHSRAEGGTSGGQGTVSDRLMVAKNVQALAMSLKIATPITAPLMASTVNGPHGEHAVTRVAEAHKIGLGRAPPLNMAVLTA